MTTEPLTFMAVHAHPDDEASSTGGVLARYASEGIRTVLVTCTNGELGDGPNGVKPGEEGHTEAEVVAHRRAELDASCQVLNVSNLELLDYHDSGMMGWPQNEAPEAFWNVPVEDAAKRLVALIEQYRPQVIATYDERGFYGHPDHIQANRITLAALEMTDIPRKLYYPIIPKSAIETFRETLEASGADVPEEASDMSEMGTDDALIGAVVDCTAFAETKFKALEAHGSQTDNSFFLDLGLETFKRIFSVEIFLRKQDKTGAVGIEDDLFGGLR
ncbi:MAG TPA: PIG-L family deacetylase [Acidimicrobiales bacterium]|jgi:LmbE family N-acetylglucosaminyl deacetylase|nr:PIG-L family deacetylase [Acidimicrobiales bacterium]